MTRSNPPSLHLADVKTRAARVDGTASASLWNLGDGVALFEIHTFLNLCDEPVLDLLARVPEIMRREFRALVIGSEDPRAFSAGASLAVFIEYMAASRWDAISRFLARGHDSLLALRYGPFPVVAATHGLTTGGGCELMLHTDAVVTHTDIRAGFPERWIGIVPGWGGVTQMLRRCQAHVDDPLAAADRAFDVIARAEVLDLEAARNAGILGAQDAIVTDRSLLLASAKQRALTLAENYLPPATASLIAIGNRHLPRYDEVCERLAREIPLAPAETSACRALATILCGGNAEPGPTLSERDVMRLEHDRFMELIQDPAVLARMCELRSTGKRPAP